MFRDDQPATSGANHDRIARADAMISSLRRVVEKGLKDGVLRVVPVSQRYSLGVTFADGKGEL